MIVGRSSKGSERVLDEDDGIGDVGRFLLDEWPSTESAAQIIYHVFEEPDPVDEFWKRWEEGR